MQWFKWRSLDNFFSQCREKKTNIMKGKGKKQMKTMGYKDSGDTGIWVVLRNNWPKYTNHRVNNSKSRRPKLKWCQTWGEGPELGVVWEGTW